MQKINSGSDLSAAIIFLENKHQEESEVLKQKFHLAYESIKPINMIKNTLKEAAGSFDIKENLFITSVGILGGFLTRKYVAGNPNSHFRQLLGPALLLGITTLVAAHPEEVKRMGRRVLGFIGRVIGVRRMEEVPDDIPGEPG
ncbi:MAG: hypothetical protein IPN74_19315 [Haliscomenobacter sp.]|nr:hypothetical protein [Haliscomenobacter sp.]MBK8880576.1 hypothetical protein [Haliscomenobacter sp.]